MWRIPEIYPLKLSKASDRGTNNLQGDVYLTGFLIKTFSGHQHLVCLPVHHIKTTGP